MANPMVCQSFDKPLIVSSTESADPNDAIALQGSGFGRTPQVWLSEVQGNEPTPKPTIRLKILTNSDSLVAARLPSSISRGLYAVWIFNGIAQDGPVWINRPRATSREFSQISPSRSFRLWGRNLVLPGRRPWVRFVNTRDSSVLLGLVTAGDPYQLAVTSPSNLAIGASYSLIISNGFGGKWGESKVNDPIAVRRPDGDPLHLGVPWSSDLFGGLSNTYNVKTDRRLPVHALGDGIADDRIPIQLAIDAAFKDGGGTVFLPEGLYTLRLRSDSSNENTRGSPSEYGLQHLLTLRSRVVVIGADRDRTRLEYGDQNSPPGACGIVWARDAFASGLDSLTILNSNPRGGWLCNIRNLSGGNELFIHNVRINLDTQSEGLSWNGVSHVLLADSLFSLGSQNGAPYFIQSSSWYIVRSNVFKYLRKRMTVLASHDGLIEGNHSTRDFKLPLVKPGDSGGLDADFVERLTILNNTFDSDGKVTQLNDGETINSQGCNSPGQSLGSVGQSSATGLADSTAHWPPLEGYIVAIVTGREAGEWRAVMRNTTDSLAVDIPWRSPPAPGSHYVITRWSAQGLLVKGNRLDNNPKGVWLYCGGTDLAVVNNSLNNSSGIWLRADQRLADNRFNLLLAAHVANNTVDSSIADRPAFVAIELARVKTPNLFGTGIFNVNVRGNSVSCNYSAPPNPHSLNGYWNDVTTPDSDPISNFSQPGIVGTIFQKNTLSGCRDAYNLSTGDSASLIISSTVSKRDVHDQVSKGAPFGSDQSFIGP